MSTTPPSEAVIHLNRVQHHRLAGGKRFMISVSARDAWGKMKPYDLLRDSAGPVSDCLSCGGLGMSERKRAESDITDYTLKCGRERRGEVLTCGDGAKVLVGESGALSKFEPVRAPSNVLSQSIPRDPSGGPSMREVMLNLKKTKTPVRDDAYPRFWVDEMLEIEGKTWQGERYPPRGVAVPKDHPQTSEGDTW